MKKIVLSLVVIFSALCCTDTFANSAHIEIKEANPNTVSYKYCTVGALLMVPELGFGYREHNGVIGSDYSINCASFMMLSSLSASRNRFAFCFKDKSLYAGFGVSGSVILSLMPPSLLGTIGGNLIFGKEFTNNLGKKRFLEAQLQIPSLLVGHISGPPRKLGRVREITFFPLLSIKYGIEF